jgi:CheY-like chemotaxis protein
MHYAPNIMFLDIDLPKIKGHQVLSKIKTLDPKGCVVMISANSFPEDVKKAAERGASGFLAKPYTKQKLTNCIHSYLDIHKSKDI